MGKQTHTLAHVRKMNSCLSSFKTVSRIWHDHIYSKVKAPKTKFFEALLLHYVWSGRQMRKKRINFLIKQFNYT